MDELEFGDSEIQAIMDIRPSSVVAAKVDGQDGPDIPRATGREADHLNPNLFEYFGFTEAKNLDPGTFRQILEVKRSLEKELENVDEWFKLLRIVERQFNDRNPYDRLNNVFTWLRLKQGDLIRSVRDQKLIDPLDIYVEHAKVTGDWSIPLKFARKRETEANSSHGDASLRQGDPGDI